jgi:hypothetical protein
VTTANLKPYKAGQSGNPNGRPRGARNKATVMLEAMLDGEGEEVARKCIDLAKAGDTTCIRLVMERVLPPRKDRPVSLVLPKLETAGDAVTVTAALFAAVAAGEVTPSEAGELSKMVQTFVQAVETQQLEQRLSRLEASGVGK